MTLSNVEKAQDSFMYMELENQALLMSQLDEIPSKYANVILPGHEPKVFRGTAGLLISQYYQAEDHQICMNYFIFRRPSTMKIWVVEPCTTFWCTIENSPIIWLNQGKATGAIKIPAKEIEVFKFTEASERYRADFDIGTYISLHITVPADVTALINDRQWIFKKLNEYGSLLKQNL